MRVRRPVHFYHLYAGGTWPQPLREHAAALERAGFDGDIAVGLVGDAWDRTAARGVAATLPCLPRARWLEWDDGYEQRTLSAMRQWARDAPPDTPVLYAHAKGSADNSEWNAIWRRSMTHHVVGLWEICLAVLEEGYDTVGCHWLTPERDNDPPDRPVTTPMYGGNFWWATAGYLAALPEPGTDYRHQAEEWVGLGSPKAYDLLAGWPTLELCSPYSTGPAGTCPCPRCRAVRAASGP